VGLNVTGGIPVLVGVTAMYKAACRAQQGKPLPSIIDCFTCSYKLASGSSVAAVMPQHTGGGWGRGAHTGVR
jgi:hypothetical protein